MRFWDLAPSCTPSMRARLNLSTSRHPPCWRLRFRRRLTGQFRESSCYTLGADRQRCRLLIGGRYALIARLTMMVHRELYVLRKLRHAIGQLQDMV